MCRSSAGARLLVAPAWSDSNAFIVFMLCSRTTAMCWAVSEQSCGECIISVRAMCRKAASRESCRFADNSARASSKARMAFNSPIIMLFERALNYHGGTGDASHLPPFSVYGAATSAMIDDPTCWRV